MQKTITEPTVSIMSQSHPFKSKKVCLMKIFKNKNLHSYSNPQQILKTQNYNQFTQKQQYQLKTQRLHNYQPNQQQNRQISQIRVKTQTIQKVKKHINIFSTNYVDCLKSGYISVSQQKTKLKDLKKQAQTFQGPVFYSQRTKKNEQNPQRNLKTTEIEQQIYKCDKNPNLIKFKVSLKKNNFNVTEMSKNTIPNKKDPSRVLITQLKTEMSERFPSQSNSHQFSRFISQKRSLSIQQKDGFDPRRSIHNSKKHSLHIPQLSEDSNIFKSIKIFQRKRLLLGQIEVEKGLQQKYGKRILEFMLRDRYKEFHNKNDFIYNIKNENQDFQASKKFKNKFITEIEEGKYDKNFLFKQKQIPLKIKGKSSRAKFNVE